MKMNLNTKEDCIDSITKTLERTAAWRKSTSIRFPDDPRNTRAVERLNQLAADAFNLTDEQWSDLQPWYGWASEEWRNGLNQTARQVGFFHRAGDLAFFVKALLQNLSLTSSIAA